MWEISWREIEYFAAEGSRCEIGSKWNNWAVMCELK